MVAGTETELLPGFKSCSNAPTVATFATVPLVAPGGSAVGVTATTLVTRAVAPTPRLPRFTVTLAGLANTVPCDAPAETSVNPAGKTLVNATVWAVFGPPLVMV